MCSCTYINLLRCYTTSVNCLQGPAGEDGIVGESGENGGQVSEYKEAFKQRETIYVL